MLNTTRLFLAFLYLRIAAAIVDMRFGVSTSPLVSVMTLGFICLVFLTKARLRHVGIGLFWVFVVIAGLGVFSMVAQPMRNPGAASSFVVQTLLYAGVALGTAALFRTQQHLRWLYDFCVVYLAIGAFSSVYQIVTRTGLIERDNQLLRAYGIGFHPVDYGMIVVILLVLAEVCRRRAGVGVTWTYRAVILSSLVALYFTQARTAWVMLALVGVSYVYARSKGIWKVTSVLGVGLGGIWLVFVSGRFEDLTTLPAFLANTAFDATGYDYRLVDSSMAWRIVNWVMHYHVAWENPLIGYGPGQARDVSYFQLEMHNAFLEYFIELGLPGLATLTVGIVVAWLMHKRIKQNLKPYRGAYAMVAALSLSILISMASSVGFLDQTAATMFMIMLLVVGSVRLVPLEGEQSSSQLEVSHRPRPALA
ncbi:O-antigen ligase family protein [Devosia marina]|uniref:O-antigen ligase-related domain-containing protein n=1 Tax=Devosia marina TaxID=2683198 RepID=A0A7X3K4T3_9HYPH|nr:O-antigen ligase family protein [Devosia marina]MVT00269.1 hypothetical protein [Devosia marina]